MRVNKPYTVWTCMVRWGLTGVCNSEYTRLYVADVTFKYGQGHSNGYSSMSTTTKQSLTLIRYTLYKNCTSSFFAVLIQLNGLTQIVIFLLFRFFLLESKTLFWTLYHCDLDVKLKVTEMVWTGTARSVKLQCTMMQILTMSNEMAVFNSQRPYTVSLHFLRSEVIC